MDERIGNNAEKSDLIGVIHHFDDAIIHLSEAMQKLTVQEHPELRGRTMEILRPTRELQAMVAKESQSGSA